MSVSAVACWSAPPGPFAAFAERPFARASGADLPLSAAARAALPELQRSFASLPTDNYLPPSRRFRSRRFAELDFEVGSGRLEARPRRPFFQTPAVNPLYGGVLRRFEPVDPCWYPSPLLHELIALDHLALVARPGGDLGRWRIGLHQIRVVGTDALPGDPTPEGAHRDGHRFVGIHLFDRQNGVGAALRLLAGEEVVAEIELAEPLDSILLDDRELKHVSTPLLPRDPAPGPAVRDVILLTWDPA